MTQDAKVTAALKLAIDCILDAARAAGPTGAPSGVIYAALSARFGADRQARAALCTCDARLGDAPTMHANYCPCYVPERP